MAVPANVAHKLLSRNGRTSSASWFRRSILERIDYDPVMVTLSRAELDDPVRTE